MSIETVAPTPVIDVTPGSSSGEVSIADLRAMFSGATVTETPKAEEKSKEAATQTETPAAKPEGEAKTETDTGTVETKQEPEEVEEVPRGVKKRIAQEVEKQVRLDAEITRVRSETKAKEAELEKLRSAADKKGSDPVKTTESAKDGRPLAPIEPELEDFETFALFTEAKKQYRAEFKKYEDARDAWLVAETEKTVEAKLAKRQRDEANKREWDAAMKEHGKELTDWAGIVVAAAPEDLQTAIAAQENWSGITKHLATNPDELKAMVEKFATNPYGVIADLGRLEDRLKPAPKTTPAKVEKPMPTPPAKVGGSATADAGVDLETAEMPQFKAAMKRILDR